MISILTPLVSEHLNLYKEAVESLSVSCSDFNKVELLVKTDSERTSHDAKVLLKDYKFKNKVICTNATGYQNMGVFCDQLIEKSSGNLFMVFCADCRISGNWVDEFMGTRNRYFDNIYVVNTRPKSHWSMVPVFSIEWYKVLGRLTPPGAPNLDSWLRDVSVRVNRYITIPNSQVSIEVFREQKKLGSEKKRNIRKGRLILRSELSGAVRKISRAINNGQ